MIEAHPDWKHLPIRYAPRPGCAEYAVYFMALALGVVGIIYFLVSTLTK